MYTTSSCEEAWEKFLSDLNARGSCASPKDWPVIICVVYLFILFIHKGFLSIQVPGTLGARDIVVNKTDKALLGVGRRGQTISK